MRNSNQIPLFVEAPDGTWGIRKHTWTFVREQYKKWEAKPNRATKPNKEGNPYIMNYWWGELRDRTIINTPHLAPGPILMFHIFIGLNEKQNPICKDEPAPIDYEKYKDYPTQSKL